MNFVYIVGGVVVATLAVIGRFCYGYSNFASALAAFAGAIWIYAGIANSDAVALQASVVMLMWAIYQVPRSFKGRK